MVIGKKAVRTRVLTDYELRLLWKATDDLAYPYGPLFRLLVLTGQRKSEVAEARWREIDLSRNLWTIPAERMKADAAHAVPLSVDAIAVLKSLPRFQHGDHLFSTTFGKNAVNGFSKAKARVDELMLGEARALVKCQGDDPANVKLDEWRIHDIRRTMRTGLSSLPVSASASW
jgi:integrase